MTEKIEKLTLDRFIPQKYFKLDKIEQNISEVVSKVYSGDYKAFNSIDVIYRDHLLTIAFRKNKDRNFAKDLVQDALSGLFMDIIEGSFSECSEDSVEQKVLSKLFKKVSFLSSARNSGDRRFANKFENKAVFIESVGDESFSADDIIDDSFNYLDGVSSREEFSMLQIAVDRLKLKRKMAVEMSFYKRMKREDLCEEMGISKRGFHQLISDGISDLRKIMKK